MEEINTDKQTKTLRVVNKLSLGLAKNIPQGQSQTEPYWADRHQSQTEPMQTDNRAKLRTQTE